MRAFIFITCLLSFSQAAVAQTPAASFTDFPPSTTTARAGESVLAPSFTWIEGANLAGDKKTTSYIYYAQTMVNPGATSSTVKFLSPGEREVANSWIIALPKGQKAKVGDTVLTWWQSGSGMQRGWVVEAKDPTSPSVMYLGLGYDNPAKNKEGVPIGQMVEKLKPDSFVKLNPGDLGSVLACDLDGAKARVILVARAAEQLLVLKSSTLLRTNLKACGAVPLTTAVKAGDKAMVDEYGRFKEVVIKRVDAKIGRVFIDRYGKEAGIAFGDVYTALVPLK